MKRKIRTPFFEIGVKNFLYGDDVLKLALAADKAAERYDIDVLFISPYIELRRVAEQTKRLIVFAPHMDTLRPGRGVADILPEAIKAAGAAGVILNHAERPISLSYLAEALRRAKELELLSFVCADTIEEVRAVAQLHPDIINPEQTCNIGIPGGVKGQYAADTIRTVKEADQTILVEMAAGIRNGDDVYRCILEGADGVGAASGICLAEDPCRMADEMVAAVQKAKSVRKMKGL